MINNHGEIFIWTEVHSVEESEKMWWHFKDKIKLHQGINGKPNLRRWIQEIYDTYVKPEDKTKSRKIYNKYMTCQSAAKEGNRYAIKICSLLRWIHEQEKRGSKGHNEVMNWLNLCK